MPESQVEFSTDTHKRYFVETGNVVEWVKEDNYKFKLAQMKPHVLKWLEQNPNAVYPPQRLKKKKKEKGRKEKRKKKKEKRKKEERKEKKQIRCETHQ